MIVKIAVVPPTGRIQISTTTTAPAKDGPPVAAAITGSGNTSTSIPEPMLAGNRKAVCVCNAECRLQALRQPAGTLDSLLKKHGGSLDQLLQFDEKSKQLQTKTLDKGYRLEKSYHQINGDIFEITRKVPTGSEHKEQSDPTTKSTVTLSRKKSLSKQLSQPQIPIRKSDLTELICRPEKPQPPPRVSSRQQSDIQSNANIQRTVNVNKQLPKQASIQQHQDRSAEHFDRAQRQRHSSRSVGATASNYDGEEWVRDKDGNTTSQHQRHSSGPSDLTLHQNDISDWLLKLPHKRPSHVDGQQLILQQQKVSKIATAPVSSKQPVTVQKQPEVQFSKSLKDELVQILKRPLQRQHSGPNELSLLRNDIFDWLRSQSFANKVLPATQAVKEDQPIIKSAATLNTAFTTKCDKTPVPRPRKRHSLGHENVKAEEIPDWIPYPLARLSAEGREKLGVAQSSCVDINKKLRSEKSAATSSKPDRRLRHSASEVVASSSDKIMKLDRKPTVTNNGKVKDKYQYIYKSPTVSCGITLPGSIADSDGVAVKKERVKRHQTQRSATVMDIATAAASRHSRQHHQQSRKSLSAERRSRSSSLPRCTDPLCPLVPVCTDPNCCAYDCYNTSRSLPRCHGSRCTPECQEYRCNSLPRCMDSKCLCRPHQYLSGAKIVKHNSLPRCVSSGIHQIKEPSGGNRGSISEHQLLTRGDSRASLPRLANKSKTKHQHPTSGLQNGKLIKSLSAASLNSRRRRHKTVHFGENLLREVCQNRKLIEPLQQKVTTTPSCTAPLNSNIQLLYNFVEGVLSSWVDEDDDLVRSGAESEPERGGGAMVRPIHRCNRLRMQTIKRVVTEAAQLRGTLRLGNSRYRHRHWRGTAKECNERFLKKVCTLQLCNVHIFSRLCERSASSAAECLKCI